MSNSSQGDSHCRASNWSRYVSAAPLSSPYPHPPSPTPIPPLSPPSLPESSSPPPPFLLFLCLFSASYSKPVVTLEPESNLRPGDAVALTCVAYGGYPQADVIWQDGGGRNLTDNITTSLVANEKGLFSMTSVLTVVLEPNSTYSCRLINPLLGEEGYASVTITGGSSSLFLYQQLCVFQSTLSPPSWCNINKLIFAGFLQCLNVTSQD